MMFRTERLGKGGRLIGENDEIMDDDLLCVDGCAIPETSTSTAGSFIIFPYQIITAILRAPGSMRSFPRRRQFWRPWIHVMHTRSQSQDLSSGKGTNTALQTHSSFPSESLQRNHNFFCFH